MVSPMAVVSSLSRLGEDQERQSHLDRPLDGRSGVQNYIIAGDQGSRSTLIKLHLEYEQRFGIRIARERPILSHGDGTVPIRSAFLGMAYPIAGTTEQPTRLGGWIRRSAPLP